MTLTSVVLSQYTRVKDREDPWLPTSKQRDHSRTCRHDDRVITAELNSPRNQNRHVWGEHSFVGEESRISSHYQLKRTLFEQSDSIFSFQINETCHTINISLQFVHVVIQRPNEFCKDVVVVVVGERVHNAVSRQHVLLRKLRH